MTYQNPVISGFHPDPSVCRVGDEYILVHSSFTYVPGVPVFRSRNLVDWLQIGNVLVRPSQLDLTATVDWSSLGIYAPTIRHHDGRFWVVTTNVGTNGARNFLVTAEDPAGPWSDPVPLPVAGIDPDIAWDDEGNCWAHFSGLGGIARCRIDTTTGQVLAGPDLTWSGTGLQYPESPHLFERDGTWYLMIAEGGTHQGHAVSIAGSLARRPVGGRTVEPDPESPEHRPADPEHGPRGHGAGDGRVLVDGPPGSAPSWHRARLPRARPRDVPDAGGLGRRLAGSPRRAIGDGRQAARSGGAGGHLRARRISTVSSSARPGSGFAGTRVRSPHSGPAPVGWCSRAARRHSTRQNPCTSDAASSTVAAGCGRSSTSAARTKPGSRS